MARRSTNIATGFAEPRHPDGLGHPDDRDGYMGALIVELAYSRRGTAWWRGQSSRTSPTACGAGSSGPASTSELHAILVTGGTGVSARDPDVRDRLGAVLTRPLPGYGELFRMLSYAEIGPACMLSREVGGLIGRVAILVMPGSRAAVQLAMARIILPRVAPPSSGPQGLTHAARQVFAGTTWLAPRAHSRAQT